MRTKYRRSGSAVWRHSHDGVLVLANLDQEVVALTGTADDLWQLLDTPRTLDQVSGLLAEAYAGSPEQITADLARLLADLVERRVLEQADTS